MSEAEANLSDGAAYIVLLDLGLPDAQGLDAVRGPTRPHPMSPSWC